MQLLARLRVSPLHPCFDSQQPPANAGFNFRCSYTFTTLKLTTFLVAYFAVLLAGAAVDVAAQHVFLEPCERAHYWQPDSCY